MTDTSVTSAPTTTTTEPPPVTEPAPTVLPAIVVNELLVNPVGTDTEAEFIELWNPDAVAADLSEWSLVNTAAKSYTFTSISIPANGFLALPYAQTKVALTNTGGTITLRNPSGATQSTVTYGGDGKEGQSYARTSTGSYAWTATPTPGAANQFPAPAAATDTSSVTTSTTMPVADTTTPVEETTATPVDVTSTGEPVMDTATGTFTMASTTSNDTALPCDCDGASAGTDAAGMDSADSVTMAELHELSDGTQVTVRGIVSLPPGRVGKTIFAMQDARGSAGVYVRMYGTERPTLEAGDAIVVSGKIAHANGSVRITTGKNGVIPTGNAPGITAEAIALADLEGTMDGVTVAVQGALVESGKGWMRLGDESGRHELRVNFGDGHAFTNVPKDAAVTVSGVLQFKNGVAELLADAADMDFTVPVAQAADATATPTQIADVKTGASSPLVGGALALSPILASLGVIGWKRVRGIPAVLS